MNTSLQIHKTLHRNIRILGAAALLILGALGIWLAKRPVKETHHVHQKIVNEIINNEYFTNLVTGGGAERSALEEVAEIVPRADGFIGLSREKLTFAQSSELAGKAGAEILDISFAAREGREELTGWLEESFPGQLGRTAWIRDNHVPKLIDSPDVFEPHGGEFYSRSSGQEKALNTPRHVFLQWPRGGGQWENKGWSWTIPPQYDEVLPFSHNGLARVRAGGLWGLIDRSGEVVQAPAFDEIREFSAEHGSAKASKDGKWGLLDRNGKIITPPEWDDVQEFIRGFAPVQRDGKWGYVDATGTLAIPCEWDDAWRFSLTGHAIVTRNGKRGFIDRTGEVIVPPVWDGAVNFAPEGLAMVRRGGESHSGWRLIDTSGNVLSRPLQGEGEFWKARRFDLGYLGPLRNESSDNITRIHLGLNGEALAASEAGKRRAEWAAHLAGEVGEKTSPSDDGLVRKESGGKWGFADQNGNFVVSAEWDEAKDFSEGLAAVKRDDKWGFVDTTGKVVAIPEWDEAGPFSEGLAGVLRVAEEVSEGYDGAGRKFTRRSTSRKWFFINKKGETVFGNRSWPGSLSYGNPSRQTAETYRVSVRGRDYHGIIPVYRGGYAQVGSVILDTRGNEFSASGNAWPKLPAGLQISSSGRGSYRSRDGSTLRMAIVDADGETVMPGVNQRLANLPAGNWNWLGDHIPYATPPKYGLMDVSGKVLVEPAWDDARILSPDRVWFKVDGKCGLADQTGRIVIEPKWDELQVLPVDSGTLGSDGKTVLPDRRGTSFLSPWVRAREGRTTRILRINGEPAIPDTLAGAEYVDFYGPDHIVISQPRETGGRLLSVYEPATGRQARFPGAAAFRWNWNIAVEGLLWAQDDGPNGVWRLMKMSGEQTGHTQPAEQKPDGWGFHEGRTPLHKPGGWTYVDTKLDPLSPDQWEEARDFHEGRAAVKKDGLWGFIGLDGKIVSPTEWEEALDFNRGLAAVKKDGLWGYLDLQGNTAIAPVWDRALSFEKWQGEPEEDGGEVFLDVARVDFNNMAALIDREGRLVVDPTPRNISWMGQGPAVVHAGGEWIVKNVDGTPDWVKRAEPEDNKHIWRISPARGWKYTENGRRALVDETGRPLTPPVWNEPYYDGWGDRLAGGLISARTPEQRYGLLRKDGSTVVEPEFDRIAWVSPGVAAAWSPTGGGLIDAEGKWIFRDNDRIRIARFGDQNARTTAREFRHGLVVIEDTPRWGYARLNR